MPLPGSLAVTEFGARFVAGTGKYTGNLDLQVVPRFPGIKPILEAESRAACPFIGSLRQMNCSCKLKFESRSHSFMIRLHDPLQAAKLMLCCDNMGLRNIMTDKDKILVKCLPSHQYLPKYMLK